MAAGERLLSDTSDVDILMLTLEHNDVSVGIRKRLTVCMDLRWMG